MHNYFVVNSVSFEDGRKLRYSNKELQNFKNVNDHICEREGLNIVREPGISKTPGDKFNAKDGTGEQFVEGVLSSITREIAGIEARAKGEPRESKGDTRLGNREDKRIEDKQRTIEREHRGRTRDFGR
ncbi:relaxase/mobilization nuclease domain-containing protein (plasmid) [Clostridium sp. FAM 1755]|uniref:relaxase/mobilization nuclease domain-containing protein n=1 Tax=Clostridium caseinilyticum TaxID=3350403 RepID=UPI0038F7FADC